MKKKIIWGIVILVLIGGSIAAYIIYNMATEKTKTAADVPTDMEMDAETIMKEFIKDAEAATSKYRETAIEITGTISVIEIEDEDQLKILFETKEVTTDPDFPMPRNVSITFEPDMKEKMKKFKVGEKVTVKGLFSDFDPEGDVQFNRGIVL